MIGKIKALGLVFVAITALSAVGASAAQAGELDPGAQPAVLTAEQTTQHVFTFQDTAGNAFLIECKVSTFEGTTQGTKLTDFTVTPTFSGCIDFVFPVEIKMNGCKYTFTGAGEPSLTYKIDIVGCTAGKKIEIGIAVGMSCTLTVGEQNGLSHVVFANMAGPPKDTTSEFTLSGITVTQFGAECPDGNAHTGTRLTFAGNTTVKASKDNGTLQVKKHGHQYTEHLCGNQVELIAT